MLTPVAVERRVMLSCWHVEQAPERVPEKAPWFLLVAAVSRLRKCGHTYSHVVMLARLRKELCVSKHNSLAKTMPAEFILYNSCPFISRRIPHLLCARARAWCGRRFSVVKYRCSVLRQGAGGTKWAGVATVDLHNEFTNKFTIYISRLSESWWTLQSNGRRLIKSQQVVWRKCINTYPPIMPILLHRSGAHTLVGPCSFVCLWVTSQKNKQLATIKLDVLEPKQLCAGGGEEGFHVEIFVLWFWPLDLRDLPLFDLSARTPAICATRSWLLTGACPGPKKGTTQMRRFTAEDCCVVWKLKRTS